MRAVRIAVAAGLVLAGGLAVLYVLTPSPEHVTPGCIWWTAKPVDQLVAGQRGCIRGYFVSGGGLADSASDAVFAVHMDFPPRPVCTYRPGDAVVVRGEAVYGDGRTVILVTDCR